MAKVAWNFILPSTPWKTHAKLKCSNISTLQNHQMKMQLQYSVYSICWLSMVLRLRQHNIGYTTDSFYRSDNPTNSIKALKEGG